MQSTKKSTPSRKQPTPAIKTAKAAVTAPAAEKNPAVKRAAKAVAAKETPVIKKTAGKCKPVTFKVQSKPGSKVYLAGDFNEWNNLTHELIDHDGNGVYQLEIELEPRVYEYKFKINDAWCVDSGNPNFSPNHLGTLNSVITIE